MSEAQNASMQQRKKRRSSRAPRVKTPTLPKPSGAPFVPITPSNTSPGGVGNTPQLPTSSPSTSSGPSDTTISVGPDPDPIKESRDLSVLESLLQRFQGYADLPLDGTESVHAGALADLVHDSANKAIQQCLDAKRDPPGWVVQAFMDTGVFRQRMNQVGSDQSRGTEAVRHESEPLRSENLGRRVPIFLRISL